MNLDHCKATSLEGLSDEFVNLELLSMVGVGLESLSGMPKLPKLKVLELTNNSISGGLEDIINCPNLQQLNLTYNKIASVDALTPLAKLSNLTSLDLFHCDIVKADNYRKVVFAALPNLKYLDNVDKDGFPEPGVVGIPNGEENTNGNGDTDDDDDEDDNDSDDDEEEEYGIEALQRSEDLDDDDEEDYAPGEEEEAELDEYDDLDDEEEEDDDVEDDGANLSGAGVTGPRRPSSKRRRSVADNCDESEPIVKQKASQDAVDNHTPKDN